MRRLRQLDTFTLVAAVLVLVPPIAAVVVALREPWMPTTDWARIELSVRDVGTGDTPLVGPYSRFGWDHPGPLMFYVMAPLYRLVPADHGLLFATAMTNLLFSVAVVAVVLRYPRSRALVALVAFALFSRGIGVADLTDPWNPTIALVPFALFLLLCVEVAEGQQRWPLLAAVAVACFVAQSHAGLLPVVTLVGGAALGLRLWRIRQASAAGDDSSSWPTVQPLTARTVGLAGGLGLVLWLPPLIDQAAGDGNLGKLARFTLGMDDTPLGPIQQGALSPGEVVTTASWLLNPFGRWWRDPATAQQYGFHLLGSASPLFLLVVVAMLAAAVLVPRYLRRQPPDTTTAEDSWGTSATVVTAASVVATFVAMFSLRGTPFYYLGRWTMAVVMLLWVGLGWLLIPVLRERFTWLDGSEASTTSSEPASAAARVPVLATGATAAGLIGLVALSAVVHESATNQPAGGHSDALRRLEPAMSRVAQTEERVATTLDRDVILFNDITHGFVVWLERNGVDWVDSASDSEAEGRYHYAIESLQGVLENPLLEESETEIVATSGPPDGGEGGDDELALTRTPVERIRELAWSEGAVPEAIEDLGESGP